jgi:glutamate N-acetyltransferase/amino-acid N-acetyltransferase
VIGIRLPLDKLLTGLRAASAELAGDGGQAAAEAIMTTDTRPKAVCAERDGFAVGGMAKGAGMIHPLLATLLVVLTTDYPLSADDADTFLRAAVEKSFNRISVDGDCSTNDTVILLANGASGANRSPDLDASFRDALQEVCDTLARQLVEDGEGVSVVLEIAVTGAADDRQARAIAARIATSPLVKTAAYGRDPNWGRVLMAAGSAPWNGGYAEIDPERVTLTYNGTVVLERGAPLGVEPDVSGPSCAIELDLGLGPGRAGYLTSDLSYDYVRINADYRS